ncbi:MAG: cyclic nucleotide-binding domain-containing protein [bacterium]
MDDRVREKLKKISIFKKFAEDNLALEKIGGIIRVVKFKNGGYIIKEGEQGDDMFILNEGRVCIEKKTLQNENYTVVELTDAMHVFFGELALMDDDVRSASVMAVTDCECFKIKKDDFERLGDEDTKVGLYVTREIAKILAKRLRNANKDSITLFSALVTEIEGME